MIAARRVLGKMLRMLGYQRARRTAAPRTPPPLSRIRLDQAGQAEMLARATNPMEAAYYRHDGRGAIKWHHYLEVYERHLARFRGQAVNVLEIGIFHGGSLQIWKSYFGERAIVHGIDIDPSCARVAEERIVPHIGDQADVEFLKRVVREMGRVDVVIDDGGHHSPLQIATFEALYPLVDPNGVYVCEDTRASYWSQYGGGYRKPGTFIEYVKALVEPLHVWYVEDDRIARDETFARMTLGIFFYDSMIVFEKRPRGAPVQYQVGRDQP